MLKTIKQSKVFICSLFLLLILSSAHARPPIPVIFIHGLAGSADTTWKTFGGFLEQIGWIFGGCPISLAPSSAGNFCPLTASLSPGDFYRAQFSDNQNLTFHEQGREVKD